MLIGELAERAGTSTRTGDVPADVLVFRGGEVVGSTVGARPEAQSRQTLSSWLPF